MSMPEFGKIMPIHGSVLELIGWRLVRARCSELIASEPDRIEAMRAGHAELVRTTGRDFGYDLARWRDFLLAHDEEFGYGHPYAFAAVDRAVLAAISDPTFVRLSALALIGGAEWDSRYTAARERERLARMGAVAAKDARITDDKCPACGMPLPSYRRTCKHCRVLIRGIGAGRT